MNKNEMTGKGKQVKGKVREEVGRLRDNKPEQVKGKVEQAEDKSKEKQGAAPKIREWRVGPCPRAPPASTRPFPNFRWLKWTPDSVSHLVLHRPRCLLGS